MHKLAKLYDLINKISVSHKLCCNLSWAFSHLSLRFQSKPLYIDLMILKISQYHTVFHRQKRLDIIKCSYGETEK